MRLEQQPWADLQTVERTEDLFSGQWQALEGLKWGNCMILSMIQKVHFGCHADMWRIN